MLSKRELIVFVVCLGVVLGQEECPPEEKEEPLDCPEDSGHLLSTVCNPFSDVAGPWYIYYWAAPEKVQLYPEGVTCARIFGTPLDNGTNHYQHYMYFSNGTMIQGEITSRLFTYGDKCCYYTMKQGEFSQEVQVVELDVFKYVFAIITVDGKRYLLVYVRDLRVMSDCTTSCLFETWLNRTEKKVHAFKSASTNCRCLANVNDK